MARTLWEEMLAPYASIVEPIYGVAEAGTTLGSGLASMIAGAPATGFDDQEYMKFMRDYTYSPRSQTGQAIVNKLGQFGDFMTDDLKIPMQPLNQFGLLNAIAANPAAISSQAARIGAAAKPIIGDALEAAVDASGARMYAVPNNNRTPMAGVSQGATPPTIPQVPGVLGAVNDATLIDMIGEKAVREAKLAKKVAAEAKKEKLPRAKTTKQAKKEADVFRTMEQQQGPQAVLSYGAKNLHLKPDGYGGYVGAPRTIGSPQGLGALRRSLDNQFSTGVGVINYSDPSRLGTWYDRAKAAQTLTNEPYQLPGSLNAHAVYSAGVAPESELGFALKHDVSRSLGMPDMAYRSAPMNNLDQAAAAGVNPRLGFKIGEYKNKNDPAQPNTGLFGVNDFRAAQGFGYTTPGGNIWTGGVTPTMHPFMDMETALTVDRANKAGTGGRQTWQGPHVQEVPWVLGKAQDLYNRGKGSTGRYNAKNFNGNEADAIKQAIRDANNTFEDYLYKHTASATHESIPGKSTGHVPQMLAASDAEKSAYTAAGDWGLMDSLGTDKDSLYSAVGFRQLPQAKSSGAYTNSAGQVESNPMTMARPLLDFPTGGNKGFVADTRQSTMNAVEQMRAAVDAQEAGAWNLPNTMGGISGKNSAVIDSRQQPGGTASLGAQPSAEALATLSDLLGSDGYGITATSRGALIFPFDNAAKPKDLKAVLKKHEGHIQKLIPGEIKKGVSSSGYVPGIGKRAVDADGNPTIVPTAPFSGEATSGLLEAMASAPPEVARKISESEGVRSAIKRITKRDASAGNARADIQEMRNFLSSADWNRAVEMIRAGAKPAAALAALGYSLTSMAEEK